jgi:alkylation response protein AidB-like acyl-CoA dehydrogenase
LPIYKAPQRDFRFVLQEFLDLGKQAGVVDPAFAEAETIDDFLAGAARICEEVAQPLNLSGDIEGCRWENGSVKTPKGFIEAYRRFAEDGWIGLPFDPVYNGKGLPGVLAETFYEMLSAANMALSGYVELSEAVFSAIEAHGSDENKRRYLPKLGSGEWTGAMHLTEPHAGSDLGLLRTRAEPAGDGTFRLYGDKAFITNAEHDLTENIINLVLARLPDAPTGTRGTTLFIVPKFFVGDDGNLGQRNAITCSSIEHKMGLRAAPTGIINYDGAVGYMLGRPHEGLSAMFTMVNDARLGVAIQGVSIAEVAYQNAGAYARERRQGRSIFPALRTNEAADPIIVHPDIRRMLMIMRSFTEGGRALALWVALQIDISKRHPDPAVRDRANGLVALLTPVIKAAFTDGGSEAANLALQCYGGHGYIKEHGIEQFVRDVRVTQVYEGTNGIQGIDLVRRKLSMKGEPITAFFKLVEEAVANGRNTPNLHDEGESLETALEHLRQATDWIRGQAGERVAEAVAGATDYLRLFALVALGWVWLDMSRIASLHLGQSDGDSDFYRHKLSTGRFFLKRQLAESSVLRARATSGSRDLMEIPADAF